MSPDKPKLALVNFGFIWMMAKQLQKGIKGDRRPNGWKDLNLTEEVSLEYDSALLRHYAKYKATDHPKDQIAHLADIANNAMILANLIAKREKNETS